MDAVPLLLAASSALCATAVSVLYRVYAQRRGDPGTLLLTQSLPVGLVMAVLLQPEGLAALSAVEWVAYLGSGLLWVSMSVWDVRAYAWMGVGVNAALNTGRLVVLTAVGVALFAEPMSARQALGCVAVVAGLVGTVGRGGEVSREGLVARALCVGSGALALTLDKWLTGRVDPALVTLSGYLIPGLYFLVEQRGRGEVVVAELRRSWLLLTVNSALFGLIGWALIRAIAEGELWSAMLVYETRVLLTFAVGLLWMGEATGWRRRAAAAALCLIGVGVTLTG